MFVAGSIAAHAHRLATVVRCGACAYKVPWGGCLADAPAALVDLLGQTDGGNYRRDRCAECGAYPPFPFMNGLLELLSAPLVRYVATSPEVCV